LTAIGGGDALTLCGTSSDSTHDVIIDHCSTALAHDEQLSISACDAGDVRDVTLSNNLISFGLTTHNKGTLVDSGNNNNFDVDGIMIDGNLFSQVSDRTPFINYAARSVTITNNVAYNAKWNGMQIGTAQYPEGQFIDYMNNLYWRGPETENIGMWPTDEVSTWPSQPDVWPWMRERQPATSAFGPSGSNTHVYFANNYDYVNNEDYTFGNHEGRPIKLENQRYNEGISYSDIMESNRQTTVSVTLLTPIEIENRVKYDVGCTPQYRDPIDTLAVSDALDRSGHYILEESDLGVYPLTSDENTRSLSSIGYSIGMELRDTDDDGLTDLEEWIYGK
jgi:hypothetical protein